MSPRRQIGAVVAINALSATSGGGLSVARGLCASLAAIRPEWKILMIASHEDAVPDALPTNVECIRSPAARSAASRWAFEQLSLPKILSRQRVDAMLLLGGFKVFLCACPQASVWQNAHIWTPPAETHTLKLRAYIAVQKLVMRATVSRVARNVFLSTDSATRCRQSIAMPDESLEIVPIGVDDLYISQSSPSPLARRESILLSVGDVYTHKRFELVIDALAGLVARHPKLELWIAGRILDQPCHARLLAQIDRCGLRDRVRFLGHVPQERLIELYRSTAIFVTSSRLETFGLTPIEAMTCGLPVVACRESAVPEVCSHGADYAEEPSGRALAEVIDRLLTSPEDWSNLQRRGIERSRSFAWPIVAERYAALLESMMGRASPAEGVALGISTRSPRY